MNGIQMRRFVECLYRATSSCFWITHTDVIEEFEDQSGERRLVRIEHRIDQLDSILVSFTFIFACVYYALLSLPVTWMIAGQITMRHWPAIVILAINSTYRFVLKYQERIASLVDWDHPVGRESRWRMSMAVLIGFLAGVGSGFLADWLIAGGKFTPQGIGFALILGTAEMIWNGKRIGGGAMYDEVEKPEVLEFKSVVEVLDN